MNNEIKLYVLGIVTLIVAICISAANYFFGFDFADAFYHGCTFLYSGKINPFIPLTQGCYILTYHILGDYAIGYRLTNWFIYLLGYLLSFFFLCGKEVKDKPIMLLILAASIILLPLTNSTAFCGNSFTSLFALLIFVSIIKIYSGNTKWFVALSIFLVFNTLFRFPNIVFYPAVLLVGLLVFPRKDYLKLFVSLGSSILLLGVVNAVMFGGVRGYFLTITEKWSDVNTSSGANHSLTTLFDCYFAWLKDIMSYVKMLSVITLIPIVLGLLREKIFHYLGILVYLLGQVAFVLIRLKGNVDESYFVLIYLYANLFIAIFALSLMALVRQAWRNFVVLAGFMLITVCATAGSDWTFQLWAGPAFGLIPWLVLWSSNTMKNSTPKEGIVVVCGLMLFAVSAFLFVRKGFMPFGLILIAITLVAAFFAPRYAITKIEKIDLPYSSLFVRPCIAVLLLIGVTLAIHKQSQMTFLGTPMKKMTSNFNVPMNKWMRTSEEAQQFVDEVLANYNKDVASNKVLFFGIVANFFAYYTQVGMIDGVDFTAEPSARNHGLVESVLTDRPTLYLIFEAPDTPAWYELNDYIQLDSLMQQHYYTKVVDEKYNYVRYYPLPMESN